MVNEYLDFFKTTLPQLKALVAEALGRGGDYADIFFEYSTLDSLMLKDGEVNGASSNIDFGAGIRVISNDHTGYAYCENTEFKELMKAARRAASIASGREAYSAGNISQICEVKPSGYHYPSDNSWISYPLKSKADFLLKLGERTFSKDNRITKVMASLSTSFDKTLFFNSLGEIACDSGPMATVSLTCIMESGGSIQNSRVSRSYRIGSEFLDEQLLDEISTIAVDECSLMFEARSIKGGEMPVVMAAGGSGILLHEAIGHAFEADFNRKEISIFSNKMGKRICRPGINIVDDGTLPQCRGSINIDDEGVAGQKTYMVTDGILTSYLHDRISAAHYGVASTGNGRRESFRYYPIPRMRATYMENGDGKEDELIASVKKGVYLNNFSNGQVQIGAGDFTFYVKTGYLIENGHLTAPIKDINVIGNGPEALANIVAVADNGRMDNSMWTCGKEQYCPVSCGMPSVLVSSLVVG